jgi:peptidylprolyl isomerase
MAQAKHGDTVRVRYTGTLEDGSVFDATDDGQPIEFTIGKEEVLPQFESTVVGMQVGEKRQIHIAAQDAYGDYDEDMIFEVDAEQFEEDAPELGMEVEVTLEGEVIPMIVIDIEDDVVVLDANHPLAGEDLNFEIELVEIVA